jgi:hypothetical protein
MQNIHTSEQLKAAILLLEAEQCEKGIALRAEAIDSFERFNPVNLIAYVMEDSKSSPLIIDKVLSSIIRMVTGYISDKVSGGDNGSVFRKIIGTIVKSGFLKIISTNSEITKSISKFLYENIFKKSE